MTVTQQARDTGEISSNRCTGAYRRGTQGGMSGRWMRLYESRLLKGLGIIWGLALEA